MIEALACASDGACCFVIGQIDLYWLVVAVEKSVEVFCSHRIDCVVVLVVKILLYAGAADQATS